MGVIVFVLVWAVVMRVVNRELARRERDGDWDTHVPNPGARPGLRWFFDFWDDGIRQRLP